uniref:Uncharacterized protein n=1 Tax=Bionectria ochroleuca TaxID=29856 RepID=A0A8H7KD94_BIOOC
MSTCRNNRKTGSFLLSISNRYKQEKTTMSPLYHIPSVVYIHSSTWANAAVTITIFLDRNVITLKPTIHVVNQTFTINSYIRYIYTYCIQLPWPYTIQYSSPLPLLK